MRASRRGMLMSSIPLYRLEWRRLIDDFMTVVRRCGVPSLTERRVVQCTAQGWDANG
jgi:hypothetical protein